MNDPTSLAAVLEDPNATAPQPTEEEGLAGVVQPDIGKAIHSPITDEKEIENRKLGWSTVFEKFRDNPNLQQALGIAGARLMQPVKPGESVSGNLGQAVVQGQQAFKQGELLQRQQGREDVADAQKAEMHAVQIPEVKAKTEGALAQAEERRSVTARNTALLPGDVAASETAVATKDAKVKQARALADKAVAEAEAATDTEAINKVLREFNKKKAALLAGASDEIVKKAVEAELATPTLKVDLLRQQIATSKAAAGEHAAGAAERTVRTTKERLTTDALAQLKKDDPKGFQEYVTKTGKYSGGSTSAEVQKSELWGSLYDKLPTGDSSKGNKTREQFIMERLQAAKQKDALELLVKAKQAGMSDEEINDLGLLDLAKASVAGKRKDGASPTIAVEAEAKAAWGKYEPEKYDYRREPGTGKLQRKLKGS